MNLFVSYKDEIATLISSIIKHDKLHAKWLNTLSYLENCGARKIAACEHPTLVKEEMIKHAAEEFRHAHYLKKQIAKIYPLPMDTYAMPSMLGKTKTLHYLTRLNVQTSRYLQKVGFTHEALKMASYLFVTYAIELRAEVLYPIYDELLRNAKSTVFVKSIILEEKEHLQEMEQGIKKFHNGFKFADNLCALESCLCKEWLDALLQSVVDGK